MRLFLLSLLLSSVAMAQSINPNQVRGTAVVQNSSVPQKIDHIYQINSDLYMDGIQYTTIAAAVAAVPSGGTIRISAGNYTVSSTIALASNVDIECSPNNKTVLIASSSLNATMITGTSINHARIDGCVLDGNRSGNSNLFGAITLTSATNNKIIGNHIQNFTGGAIIVLLSGADSNTIQDNEIDHFGQPLPAPINGNECISLYPNSTAGIHENDIIHNHCHDGNGGIALYNNGGTASEAANTSRNRFINNTVNAMINDAFVLFSDPTANPRGRLIQGNIFQGNIARCNGWPANGTGWDTTNCPPGFLQSGSNAGQGVGFNQNSNQADQNQFIGNRGEYNFYEGGDDTPQIFGTVNTSNGALGSCSSNCVQWVSGGQFLTTWKANQSVDIGGTFMNIASVQSATVLTLTSAPGSHTGTSFSGFTNSKSIWSGNYFSSNGNGAVPGGQGAGLAIQGGYVTSQGNIATNNGYAGFYDQAPAYVTHVGDISLFNCRLAACNEFNVESALHPSHIGVVADSNTNNALYWAPGTFNGYAESTSLCASGTCGGTTVQDNGIDDVFNDGKVRGSAGSNGATQAVCFSAGGGTGCINGGGNGYVNLPAVGSAGSPATLAVQSGISGTCSAVTVTNGIVTGCTP